MFPSYLTGDREAADCVFTFGKLRSLRCSMIGGFARLVVEVLADSLVGDSRVFCSWEFSLSGRSFLVKRLVRSILGLLSGL